MRTAVSEGGLSGVRQPSPVTTTAVFLLSTLVFFTLLVRLPVIYDADSYYHLAVAGLYSEQGTVDSLPWARFSLLQDGFSDKEWLFHVLLIPFVRGFEPTVGGRLLLAILNGVIYTALAHAAMRLWRWQGALVPAWIWIAAIPFASRANRLRPEVCGLILILAAIACVTRGRFRMLGLVMFLYTLTYTAFHALLGLCFLWCLERFWRTKKLEISMVLWPTVGAAAAFLVHPHFPKNLRFWVVQNVEFFYGLGDLDVGTEILSPGFEQLVRQELGWLIGLVVLVLATIPSREASEDEDHDERAATVLRQRNRLAATALATLAFGALFVVMGRFGFYFVPLATFTVLALVPVLGRQGSAFVRLPVGRSKALPLVPLLIGLAVAIVPGYPQIRLVWSELLRDTEPLPLERDRRQWGSMVPDGARVAAHWGDAEFYVFYAPRAQYLNLLDPVFMALPYPEIYDLQRGVFEDREPDVPLRLVSSLESDWIAFRRSTRTALFDRLMADPRIEPRYAGYHFLARVKPDSNADFFLDWTVEAPPTPPLQAKGPQWTYPRLDPRTPPSAPGLPGPASVEGFVDVGRLPVEARSHPCLLFRHRFAVDLPPHEDASRLRLELAAAGQTELLVDSEAIASSPDSAGPALGSGTQIEIELGADEHELVVITCRSDAGPHGFYLLRRPSSAGS